MVDITSAPMVLAYLLGMATGVICCAALVLWFDDDDEVEP